MIEKTVIIALTTLFIVIIADGKYQLFTRYEILMNKFIKGFEVCDICMFFWINLIPSAIVFYFMDVQNIEIALIHISSAMLASLLDRLIQR